jgi:hypothetical protein
MNYEQLLEMADHFRGLACDSRNLGSAVELTTLADAYAAAARDLERSGQDMLAAPISLPGVRQFG